MVLQFSLQCQIDSKKLLIEQKNEALAQMMVEVINSKCGDQPAHFTFSNGEVDVVKDQAHQVFTVKLADGAVIHLEHSIKTKS